MAKEKEERVSTRETKHERRPPRPFPHFTLEDTLAVAQAIQDKNAGKPMRRIFVADAIGRKPESSDFYDLLSSSYKYGLTAGSKTSEHVELTPLGQMITKPKSPEEKARGVQEAALKPDLLNRIYMHYKDAKIPTGEFFENVLEREFEVPREWVKDCVVVLMGNGRYVNIIREVAGALRVVLGEAAIAPPTEMPVVEGAPPAGFEPSKPAPTVEETWPLLQSRYSSVMARTRSLWSS